MNISLLFFFFFFGKVIALLNLLLARLRRFLDPLKNKRKYDSPEYRFGIKSAKPVEKPRNDGTANQPGYNVGQHGIGIYEDDYSI